MMSIPFSGTLSRSGGLTAAIAKQLKSINLKPVKRVTVKFDPFHESVEQTRYFMFYLSKQDVLRTNLSCSFKTQVVCDRSDPTVNFSLANGESVLFKSSNLSALEMLTLFNKHITVLAPKDETIKAGGASAQLGAGKVKPGAARSKLGKKKF